MSDGHEHGRAPRVQTNLPARLIDSHGTELTVTILDLSASGFRVRSSDSLEEGEQVRLQCGKDEPQAARIMWVRGGEAGGLFLLPPDQPA